MAGLNGDNPGRGPTPPLAALVRMGVEGFLVTLATGVVVYLAYLALVRLGLLAAHG